MKRGLLKVFTVTAAMVSMLSMSMTVCAAENYTVAGGDHLMKIAKDKYGDENKWNVIYEANKEAIKEPTKIYPGQVIVIPDLTPEALVPAAQPEAAPVPETPIVQTEILQAPETIVEQPETVPAALPEVTVEAAGVTTLEDFSMDPSFKSILDSEMQMIAGSGMDISVVFKENTMAVIITIKDSSYLVDGIGEALNEGLEAVKPIVDELVVMIEDELGNPGNTTIIYSYQTADGEVLAQRAFTAK